MPNFTELRQEQWAVWASGDYDQIARGIQAVADHIVSSVHCKHAVDAGYHDITCKD